MKNTEFEDFLGLRLPRNIQLKRMEAVIREKLTPLQRDTLTAFYFQKKSLTRIARERGVNRSTVCRTLHRAEENLRRYLTY